MCSASASMNCDPRSESGVSIANGFSRPSVSTRGGFPAMKSRSETRSAVASMLVMRASNVALSICAVLWEARNVPEHGIVDQSEGFQPKERSDLHANDQFE